MGGQNDNPTACELLYREGRYICGLILQDKTYDLKDAKDELESLLLVETPPDLDPDLEMSATLNEYSFSQNEQEGIHWVASVMARKLRNTKWYLGNKKDETDPSQAPSKFTDLVNRG